MPGREGVALASMGIYVINPEFLREALERDAADAGFAARLRPQHRARGGRYSARVRLSVRGRRDEGAALLARRRHRRRVLLRQHGAHPRQPGAQPLRRGVADLDLSAAGAGGEVHSRRGRPARARDQLDGRRRLHHLGRRRPRVAAVFRRDRRRGHRGASLGRVAPGRDRPQLLHRQRDHRRRLQHSARHRHRAGPRCRPPAFPRDGPGRRARDARNAGELAPQPLRAERAARHATSSARRASRRGVLLHPTSLPGPESARHAGRRCAPFRRLARGRRRSASGRRCRSASRTRTARRTACAPPMPAIRASSLRRDLARLRASCRAASTGARRSRRALRGVRTARDARSSGARSPSSCGRGRRWLLPYGLFELSSARFGQAPWWEWPDAYRAARCRGAARLSVREPRAVSRAAVRAVPVRAAVGCAQALRQRARRVPVRRLAVSTSIATASRSGGSASCSRSTRPASRWPWPACRPTTSTPRASSGATRSTTGTPCGAAAFAGGSTACRRSSRGSTSCASITSARSSRTGRCPPERRPRARAGGGPAPATRCSAALRAELGAIPLVAEDLGLITDEVRALRDRFELPGMVVLQFAFDGSPDNPHLPRHHRAQRRRLYRHARQRHDRRLVRLARRQRSRRRATACWGSGPRRRCPSS